MMRMLGGSGNSRTSGGVSRAGPFRSRYAGAVLEQGEVVRWLEELRVEHRDLDEVIQHLLRTGHEDHMRVKRLKKRKLKLKDSIARLESQLIPDLDA